MFHSVSQKVDAANRIFCIQIFDIFFNVYIDEYFAEEEYLFDWNFHQWSFYDWNIDRWFVNLGKFIFLLIINSSR